MTIPPITPQNLARVIIVALAIYLVMLVLPGGPMSPF